MRASGFASRSAANASSVRGAISSAPLVSTCRKVSVVRIDSSAATTGALASGIFGSSNMRSPASRIGR